MNKINNNLKGFTLIELLVVISIIAILAMVGLTAFNGAQQSARDGRRRADIDAYSKAFESNYDSNSGIYTSPSAANFSANAYPKDPNTDAFYYTAGLTGGCETVPGTSTCTTYCICALLERGGGNFGANCAGGATTYYCRNNLQ